MDNLNKKIVNEINLGKIKGIQDYIDNFLAEHCNIINYGVNKYLVSKNNQEILNESRRFIKLLTFLESENYIQVLRSNSGITNRIYSSVIKGNPIKFDDLDFVFKTYEYYKIMPTSQIEKFIKNNYITSTEHTLKIEHRYRLLNTWIAIIVGLFSIFISAWNIKTNENLVRIQSIDFGIELVNKIPPNTAIPLIQSLYTSSRF
ncbi:MAG: hypothetical protein KBA66_24110 [Leptospiraceae bacterium]|nr:hypothetical protein [Leptospiraceae bacterium]